MPSPLTGVHHVTALASDPRENLRFYTRTLGLRLVKRTVNFDDPLTYHLYYGDVVGSPGSILTHFPHPNARRARHGNAEITDTILNVPTGSLDAWAERLGGMGVRTREATVLGDRRLAFEDPDGVHLALMERDPPTGARGWAGGGIDPAHAILGVEGVVLHVPHAEDTGSFLQGALGFESAGVEGDRLRLTLGADRPGTRLEIVGDRDGVVEPMSAGTVHHVAWRVPDIQTQREVIERLHAAGLECSPVMDRLYFRSIYFRIPGGPIFEVATDGPGFDVDEPRGALGSGLRLPPQHEPRRAEIEAHLAPLDADA